MNLAKMCISVVRKLHIIICLLQVNLGAYSQSEGRIFQKAEYIIGFGTSNYLGELGGANKIGTQNSLVDTDIRLTSPSLTSALRIAPFRFKKIRIKSALSIGLVQGNDAYTKEAFRNNRNLNFRSIIIENSIQLEFFFTQINFFDTYKVKNAKRGYKKRIDSYFFLGIGAFFFNPQGKLNGKWYNLQPLSTEGQGIKPGTKKYHRISAVIPFGLGAKWKITRQFSIGAEVGFRKTFTDYLDDVSTEYYDNNEIKYYRGDIAASLADPNKNTFSYQLDNNGKSKEGIQRGNPKEKDSYYFIQVVFVYKFNGKQFSRSKFENYY